MFINSKGLGHAVDCLPRLYPLFYPGCSNRATMCQGGGKLALIYAMEILETLVQLMLLEQTNKQWIRG